MKMKICLGSSTLRYFEKKRCAERSSGQYLGKKTIIYGNFQRMMVFALQLSPETPSFATPAIRDNVVFAGTKCVRECSTKGRFYTNRLIDVEGDIYGIFVDWNQKLVKNCISLAPVYRPPDIAPFRVVTSRLKLLKSLRRRDGLVPGPELLTIP